MKNSPSNPVEWLQRMNLAQSLGFIGGNDSVKALIQMASDPVWQVRRAITEALGNIKNVDGMPTLLELLEDSEWQVRQGAGFAIGYITKKITTDGLDTDNIDPEIIKSMEDSIRNLIHHLKSDPEWRVRQACSSALRNYESDTAISALINSLEDEEWHVRCTSAESLGELGDIKARAKLEEIMQKADPMSRRIFKQALDKIGE